MRFHRLFFKNQFSELANTTSILKHDDPFKIQSPNKAKYKIYGFSSHTILKEKNKA